MNNQQAGRQRVNIAGSQQSMLFSGMVKFELQKYVK